jgi:hypothetical protein
MTTETVERDVEFDADELEASDGTPDLDKLQTDFAFRGPVALRLLVEESASEAKLGVSQFIRKIVADKVGYSLQTNAGRTTLSDAEKKEREDKAKAAAKAERAKVAATLKAQREARESTSGK